MDRRSVLDRDVAIALEYASVLYGRARLTAGPPAGRRIRWERRSVDPYQEAADLYVRALLVRLRARTARLEAVQIECHARAARARWWRRPAPGDGGRAWRTGEFRQVHRIAAELAADACRIVAAAGAVRDRRARSRLLAATRYQCARDVLDATLGDPSLAGPPDRMLAELAWLDQRE